MTLELASRRVIRLLAVVVSLGGALFAAAPARATFPGANGKIAFARSDVGGNGMCQDAINTINPDGTGRTALTTSTSANFGPTWSADGQRIAFVRVPSVDCNGVPNWFEGTEIWTMNSDGSSQVKLTNNTTGDTVPAWSPDGQKIAFMSDRDGNWEIYVMNADGSAQTRLTANSSYDSDPEWSPDGQKIAFGHDGNIYSMNPDGTGQTQITSDSTCSFDCWFDAGEPSWSPDGQRFVFPRDEVIDTEYQTTSLWLVNANGTGERQLDYGYDFSPAWSPDGKKIAYHDGFGISFETSDGSSGGIIYHGTAPDYSNGFDPDWQPLPTATYEHPQGGESLQASLVPTFRPCGTGTNPTNGQHSPPLGVQACLPPVPGSSVARIGATFVGSASFTAVAGDTDPTNGDQANVTLLATLRDVKTTAGADYVPNTSGPDLTEITRLRLTDKANNYGGASGTATEYDFRVPIECAPSTDPSTGSTCGTLTSADSLLPGFITEQRQTVVQAFRVRIDDAGANGMTGDSDDRIFATQGIYIP